MTPRRRHRDSHFGQVAPVLAFVAGLAGAPCLPAQPRLDTAAGQIPWRQSAGESGMVLRVAGIGARSSVRGDLGRYRLDRRERKRLAKYRGVHPRLFLSSKRVAELRRSIMTTHAPLWMECRMVANWLVRRGPPRYRRNDGWSGLEQAWQREVGDQMPTMALAYLLSGERPYLDAARALALASCSYPTWGLDRLDGVGLAAGHQLCGLALVYDWCYDDLGDAARRTIRETLIRRTTAMFQAAATGKRKDLDDMYLDGHMWVNLCGVAMAGLALLDETEDASMWIGLPLAKLGRTMEALGPDGASHLGVNYWSYGVVRLMMFMHVARQILGVDLWGHPWWRNTAAYLQYLTLPRGAWSQDNLVVDIADCDRYVHRGPDYLLRGLAGHYGDGHAQWLAQQMDRANVTGHASIWLNLVWFDPRVRPLPPTALPTMRWFDDMDIVSSRSDWSGRESLLVLKCGPCIGHRAVQQFDYDPGAGHVHPDANHFVLFGAGEWLVRDDGYTSKWTGQHNTLTIGGRGQRGEGGDWFDATESLKVKARPHVVSAHSSASLDHLVGDATEAYPRQLALRRYVRHLLFVKPNVLILVDDIDLLRPAELELRLHPEYSQSTRQGDSLLIRGHRATLRIELLTGENVTMTAQNLPVSPSRSRRAPTAFTVRFSTRRSRWRNAVALSWAPAGGDPESIGLHREASRWSFEVPGGNVQFDWKNGKATFMR